MRDSEISMGPIWNDMRTLEQKHLPEQIDIISGGFPCQDISVAGTKKGLDGERSGLYWELHRLVNEIKPPFVFLENVPGIRIRGLREVVSSLTDIGYDCRWTRLSAGEIGAPHRRQRWFLLAHTTGTGLERLECDKKPRAPFRQLTDIHTCDFWEKNKRPSFRMANELPRPVDAVKSLGNSVVPVQARAAFKRLAGIREAN